MQKGELVLLLWSLIHSGFCGKATRIAQRPSNILLDFNAYQQISILHFVVPENSASANFKFVAKEEKLSGIGSCKPRDVSVFLKYGSIPFVQPDGARIKAKILKNRARHYSLKIVSNGDEHLTRIDAPPPGDWYAIAFRSWSDPDNGKITQAGIGVFCDTTLGGDLSIEIPDTLLILVDEKKDVSIQLSKKNDTAMVQFPVFCESERMFLNFSSSCGTDCLFIAQVTASKKHLAGVATNNSMTSLQFSAYDKNLHYATFRLISGNETRISVTLSQDASSSKNVSYVKLVRKSLPDFFLFDYEHLNDTNKASPLNLTSGILSIFKFHVGPIYDIGGTLTIGLKIADSEAKSKKNILLIGCVSLGFYSDITAGAGCVREGKSTPPDIVGNETSPSFIHVPYPEPGIWYLTVKAFKVNETCQCAENCTEIACDKCDCIREIDLRIESSISSSSCIKGTCNDRMITSYVGPSKAWQMVTASKKK